jgi:predicted lactoylglutathione lyase
MDQRVNVITLGVEDVLRSRAFYEALGWRLRFIDGHTWEVAYIEGLILHVDGTMALSL